MEISDLKAAALVVSMSCVLFSLITAIYIVLSSGV